MTQGKRTTTPASTRKSGQARTQGRTAARTRSTADAKKRTSPSATPAKAPAARAQSSRGSRAGSSRIRDAKDITLQTLTDTASGVGDGTSRAVRATGTFLAANAIPLSLAALGLGAGLLAISALRRRRHHQAVLQASLRGEPAPEQPTLDAEARELLARGREQLVELARRASQGAQQVGEAVQDTATRVGDRAVELGHDAVDGLVTAEERALEFVKEHPVATTAAAVAAGVGIGMAIPDSALEKRVLTPVRERLADTAGAALQEAKSGVQSAFDAAREIKNDLMAQARR